METSSLQVVVVVQSFQIMLKRQRRLCTSQSKSPPPNPGHSGESRGLKLIFTRLESPSRREERTNSRSSPTRPGSKRGLHYLLISGFFFAPHGDFAYITFFSSVSIELFSPVHVQNKMLCKVFLQGSPVKKAAVVDSFESLVKKGNYFYIILFLSRFSTAHVPEGREIGPKILPRWGLFSLFHRLQIPIPRYGPAWGGAGR